MKRSIVFLIGAAVLLAACGRYSGAAPQATVLPALHPASSLSVTTYLPARDLSATNLTNVAALVTPFHVDATDNGRTITLIGRPGSDGLAHLRITIKEFEVWPPPPTRGVQSGNWSYSIAIKIQPTTQLAAPAQFALGRWTGTIEVPEVTPSVVHVQAVIHGAGVSDLEGPTVPEIVTLLDASGQSMQSVAAGASITFPKLQVNPVTYRNSRIRYEWPRPADAETLQLRFHGGRAVYTVPLAIPALDLAG